MNVIPAPHILFPLPFYFIFVRFFSLLKLSFLFLKFYLLASVRFRKRKVHIFSSYSDPHPLCPQTDLHLHCNKWDEALRSGQWEPQEIVEKLPEFLNFIKKVQNLIMDYQEAHTSNQHYD